MDNQDKKEFEQTCFDAMHGITEAFLEQARKYRTTHPEKVKHDIKLHKIEK